MKQEFSADLNIYLTKDDKGKVEAITHFEAPYESSAADPKAVAEEYLAKFCTEYGMASSELGNMSNSLDDTGEQGINDNNLELRFANQNDMFDISTVNYVQTFNNLPIWGAGMTLQIKHNPFRVLASHGTNQTEVSLKKPSAAALKKYKNVSKKELQAAMGWTNETTDPDQKSLKVINTEMYVYAYRAAEREAAHEHESEGFCQHPEHFHLPEVSPEITENQFIVVAKVLFHASHQGDMIPYVAMIEVETDSIVYLRAMTSGVSGFAFNSDPYTMTGNPATAATATDAILNPLRSPVELLGLNAPVAGIQHLKGNFVEVVNVEAPATPPPTQPTGINFNYNVRTDNFSAVNAYYHNDRFFRMVMDMGFPSTYWKGTVFPVKIDHRGIGNVMNAHCVGSGSFGIAHCCYALADPTNIAQPIGIANDWRVVLHELGGHGILYLSVNFPNFGFAHSAGDSFAAILNDPGNTHPDRFATFPWLLPSRRHDRTIAANWGWGGLNDVGGYNSEQILCTTMFRFYRSIGGDSADLGTRHFAARMTCYLLLRAIGALSPTHPTQTGVGLARVTAFLNELITANFGDWTTERHTGGAYGKVLRWAFEKQGLFATTSPTTTEGLPPAVDVYINDGRNGEYTFQPNFTNNPNIWNRRAADGITTHQEPVIGVINYAYVRIRNRGTSVATGVSVRAYQRRPRASSEFLDWRPMLTPIMAATANVPANNAGDVVVGPFQWIPTHVGSDTMTMVVQAPGDLSNISFLSPGENIPDWRLVPNDNNIGQRRVTPRWFPF